MDAIYDACVIGQTGRGGLDLAFFDLDGVKVLAVADSDPEGLNAHDRQFVEALL